MSNTVAGPTDGPSFTQQGAVDWVALSKSTLSFSVEVLSRLSKAGVELITVAVAQAIFSGFNVPPDGQQRLANAIAKLKAFASYGDILWFGFGVKHITRILCETEQGATCVAICACLSVSYDLSFASQVLKAITDKSKTPGALTPALSQWGALMNVCAGAVTDSQFPRLVEGFSRLIGGISQGCTRQPLHMSTTATALAGALLELSRVSNGNLRSVTFEGGVDCGWLAAVAQWLLSLRIEIIDDSGTCIYSNSSKSELHAQVTIIQRQSTIPNSPGANVLRRSYFIPPGSLCFSLVGKNTINEMPAMHLYSHGRSEWDNILNRTFGGAADALLQSERTGLLAEFLCSGFQPNIKTTMELLNPWGDFYIDGCYQRRRAFLNFSAIRLPELATVLEAAEKNPQVTYGYHLNPNPTSRDKSFSNVLAKICPCSECSISTLPDKNMFCLHRIGVTIFRFLWILSWLDIDTSIKPSPSGLLMLYYKSRNTYEDMVIRMLEWCDWSTSLLPLFTGSICGEKNSRDFSAIADGGICIYMSPLKCPDVDPSQILRYRVVIGQIERDGFIYRKVSDKVRRDVEKRRQNTPLFASRIGPATQFLLVVEETTNSNILEASFQFNIQPIASQIVESFVHHHEGPPNLNMSYQRPTLPETALGVCEMRDRVVTSMSIHECSKGQVEIISSKRLDKLTGSWTGQCSLAVSTLWSSPFKEVEYLPKPGEWLLEENLGPGDCCVRLLRGGYTLLYSTLCQLDHRSSRRLAYMTPCLICSTQAYLKPSGIGFGLISLPMSICSMDNSNSYTYELASFLRWNTLVEGIPAESNDHASEKLDFYKGKTKQVLQMFLNRRDIFFHKRITKQEMIHKLQENDRLNPGAAREDGFKYHKCEEGGTSDTVMTVE